MEKSSERKEENKDAKDAQPLQKPRTSSETHSSPQKGALGSSNQGAGTRTGTESSRKPSKSMAEEGQKESRGRVRALPLLRRPLACAYIDSSEACGFWQLYKEAFIALQQWEDGRSFSFKQLKNRLSGLSECVLLAMDRAHTSTKHLIAYFTQLSGSFKSFWTQLAGVSSSIESVVATPSATRSALSEVLGKLSAADSAFEKNLESMQQLLDNSIIGELRKMSANYAKALALRQETQTKQMLVPIP